MCEVASRTFPGGVEVGMTMLFADIGGSTALAEQMSPKAYNRLIHRFDTAATQVIIHADGLIEKLSDIPGSSR